MVGARPATPGRQNMKERRRRLRLRHGRLRLLRVSRAGAATGLGLSAPGPHCQAVMTPRRILVHWSLAPSVQACRNQEAAARPSTSRARRGAARAWRPWPIVESCPGRDPARLRRRRPPLTATVVGIFLCANGTGRRRRRRWRAVRHFNSSSLSCRSARTAVGRRRADESAGRARAGARGRLGHRDLGRDSSDNDWCALARAAAAPDSSRYHC